MIGKKIIESAVRQYAPLVIGALAGMAGTWLATAWPAVYAAVCAR